MSKNSRYLNCFSVVFFNVNNIYFTFQTKNYFLPNNLNTSKEFLQQSNLLKTNNKNSFYDKKNQTFFQNPEYWIIKNNNDISIKQINNLTQKLNITTLNKTFYGPFFNFSDAKQILNLIQVNNYE